MKEMKVFCLIGLLIFLPGMLKGQDFEQELAIKTSKAKQQTIRARAKWDSTQQVWRNRIDSLKRRNPADTVLAKQLNDFNQSLDSLRLMTEGKLQITQQSIQKKQAEINSKIKGVESRLNEVLESGQAGNDFIKMPLFSIPQLNDFSMEVPTLHGLNVNVSDMNLPSVVVPALNSKIPALPATGFGQLTDQGIPQLKDVKEVSGYVKDAKGVLKGDAASMKKMEGIIEQNLGDVPEIRTLEEQAELLKKWNSDPRVAKEMAITKAKEQAINHFAGHEQELKTVMAELSKVKAKVGGVGAMVDLYKKKSKNTVKELGWRERLIPGMIFQTQIQPLIQQDFNPYLYYRVTGRLSLGMGWVERLVFDWGTRSVVKQGRIFGGRGVVQFAITDGFFVVACPELVNAFIKPNFYRPEPAARQWVWSGFAGLKRDFKLSKKVRGNVQTLYNLYNPKHISPYTNRLAVRVGFELNQAFKGK